MESVSTIFPFKLASAQFSLLSADINSVLLVIHSKYFSCSRLDFYVLNLFSPHDNLSPWFWLLPELSTPLPILCQMILTIFPPCSLSFISISPLRFYQNVALWSISLDSASWLQPFECLIWADLVPVTYLWLHHVIHSFFAHWPLHCSPNIARNNTSGPLHLLGPLFGMLMAIYL